MSVPNPPRSSIPLRAPTDLGGRLALFAGLAMAPAASAQPYTWNNVTGNGAKSRTGRAACSPPGRTSTTSSISAAPADPYTATLDFPATKFQFATLSLNSSAAVTETIDQAGGRYFEFKNLTGSATNNIDQLGSGRSPSA